MPKTRAISRSRRRRQVQIPTVSVVIPIYNEEAILERAVRRLCAALDQMGRSYEVLLSTNGCTDGTIEIALSLMHTLPASSIAVLQTPQPNYGRALRLGIEAARGTYVVCDEIDLCDVDFHRRAMQLLVESECDVVIGSKRLAGARDLRPAVRRVATRVMNGLLWAATGYPGTDTHGLKAFVREPMIPIVRRCVVDKDLFASELVVRAHRGQLRVREIPIELEEQRQPSVRLLRRVPRVIVGLATLAVAVRRRP
jgi:glycosyltransferase involved in cell wall biosynthesis